MSFDRDEDQENEAVRFAAAEDRQTALEVARSAPPRTAPMAPPDNDMVYRQTTVDQLVSESYEMSEVDKRIEKASLYRALRSQELFAPGSAVPAIIQEVTEEIRAFVLSRLEALVGMRSDTITPITSSVSAFTPEQEIALKMLADKVLGRPSTPTPTPVIPTVRPVAAPATQPTVVSGGNRTVPSPAPAPAARATRNQVTRSPGKIPMPTVAGMDAKIAQDAAVTSQSTQTGGFLSAAIATALREAGERKE